MLFSALMVDGTKLHLDSNKRPTLGNPTTQVDGTEDAEMVKYQWVHADVATA